MTYILNSNSSNRGLIKKVYFFVFLLLLISTIFYYGNGFLGNISSTIFSPLLKIRNSFWSSIIDGSGFIKSKVNILAENARLKEYIEQLELKIIRESILTSELLENNDEAGLRVSILSLPPRTPYDTIIIDKGNKYGIKEGDPVFLFSEIQIGKIESVTQNTSKVRLFSSAGILTDVVILRTGESIELLGRGGGNFIASLPVNFDITQDDFLVLPGEKKIIIAKVRSIKKDEDGSFIQILSTPPIKIKADANLYVEL